MRIFSDRWQIVSLLVTAGFGLIPTVSHAQTSSPLIKTLEILTREYASCVFRLKSGGMLSGGNSESIVLWVYSYEGCNGGNNWGASVEIFYVKQPPKGAAMIKKLPPTKSMLEKTSFAYVTNVSFKTSASPPTSYVEIDGVSMGADDARCCPTAGRQVKLWFEDGDIKSTIVKTWTETK